MQIVSIPREQVAQTTISEFGAGRIRALCDALGLGGDETPLLRSFGRLADPWGRRPLGSRPRWSATALSDDRAPFEFSVAFRRGGPEVQVYLEPTGDLPTLGSTLQAGRVLLEAVAREKGVSLSRLALIEDLFLPDDPKGAFALWIGVSWHPGTSPRFKAYLNPAIRGEQATGGLMLESMSRLGFARAWQLAASDPARDPERDELAYLVCLDLDASPEARCKVYRRHHQATAAHIDQLARIAADYQPGDAFAFYGAVGGDGGPFTAKPPITSLTFRQDDLRPSSATLELPLSSYVRSDEEASRRVRRCLALHGLDESRYEAAIQAFAIRPLAGGNGIHAHVTLRREGTTPRVTVYLASEAYVDHQQAGLQALA